MHPRVQIAALTALAAAIACPSPLAAQSEPARPFVSIFGTVSQVPVEVPRVGATVTVVTAEEIEERGDRTVADVLRRVPGVNVSTAGNRGSLTQLRIRGGEANHTLVIIDGVAVNSPDNGDFDFSQLPVGDIERVEVIRGPQSGIFGANAHAGVVVIQTRTGRGERAASGSGAIEFGTNGTFQGHARVSGGAENAWGALSWQGTTTNGTDISRFGTERDGSAMLSVATSGGVALSPWLTVEGNLRLIERRADSDPQAFFGPFAGFVVDGPDRSDRRDVVGGMSATTRFLDGQIVNRTFVNGIRSRLEFFAPFSDSNTLSQRLTFGNRTTWFVPRIEYLGLRQAITVLTEHTQEDFWNAAFGRVFDESRRTVAVASEYRADFDNGLSLGAVLRRDFNDRFADATTWRFTAAYTYAATGTTVRAAVGRAVTNPTFYEQFGFFPNQFIGNPAIRPEASLGFDVGLRQSLFGGRAYVDVTYFDANLTDVIQTAFLGGGLSTVANLDGTTRRHGVEVAAAVRPFDWLDLSGSYTYTRTRDPDGLALVRRPAHAFGVEAVARFLENRMTASLGVSYVGARDDLFFGTFPATRIRLDPYTLVNARLAYRVNDNAEVFVRGENLTNVRYEDVFSYRAPGATIYAGVRLRFGD